MMYQLLLKSACLTHHLAITLTIFTHSHAAAGECSADTTRFLSWPNTLAGTTQTLPCPNTTTMISRTCSPSGVWESVDPSLCTSLTLINTVSFSVGFSIDFQCGVAYSISKIHPGVMNLSGSSKRGCEHIFKSCDISLEIMPTSNTVSLAL